ncbi:MAG: SGNH/GDSL hydrolase family protein [Chitinophagaceae bacterium]
MSNPKQYLLCVIACLVSSNLAVSQAIPDSLLPAQEFSARGGLPNFSAKIAAGKSIRIAFLGGSITRAGGGYRDQVLSWFKNQYPASQFTEIMAAVSGTGSDFGACRVEQQVINYAPDLVFVEFAVNDNRTPMQKVRETMEGIVRQIWKRKPFTDICFIYTFSAENLPLLQKKIFPSSVSAMEAIAAAYNIPSIHMGLSVADEIKQGKLLMAGKREEQAAVPLFSLDGVHPLPETGHKMYTSVLSKYLLLLSHNATAAKHRLPKAVETENWSNAGMAGLSGRKIKFKGDWHTVDSVTKGREYYQLQPQVYSTASADASLTVQFSGTRFGLADIMGPSTAAIEVSIDNQAPGVINRFDAFSTYYRLNYFIIRNLPGGKHTATVRLAPVKIDKEAILKTRNVIVNDKSAYQAAVLYIGAVLY